MVQRTEGTPVQRLRQLRRYLPPLERKELNAIIAELDNEASTSTILRQNIFSPHSGGGSSSYYKIPKDAKELNDLIEFKDMSFAVGNIFKACYRLGEKDSVGKEYDIDKMMWFTGRLKTQVSGKYYKFVQCDREEANEFIDQA